MQKLTRWLNQHILTILSGFLLMFIPLYPKIPLADALPGYNVRIRLEDVVIFITMIIFGFKVIKGKIKILNNPLFKAITLYLVIGLLSVLSAIFITKTVYPEYIQVAKVFLHWIRRIEYFSLFFIFFFGLEKKQHIHRFLGILGVTALAVTIYGFGQKYLYWPAYSTMNREFAKGVPVYLTQHARVMSTFGGHFDLAAYIMLTLIPLIVIGFLHSKKIIRRALLLVAFAEYFLLVLSASRTSWVAYIIGINVAFILLFFKKSKLWVISRWLVTLSLSILLMISVGEMAERFAHILNLEGVKEFVTKPFKSEPPANYISIDDIPLQDQLGVVATNSDTPPTTTKPTTRAPKETPDDVYDSTLEDLKNKLATGSAQEQEDSKNINVGYSENALKYGLSTGIRLDALWPQAIKGFLKNPLLGSGYSTLTKTNVWEFTFAESTDNDYLRLLGETGLLGFISYLAVFYLVLKITWQAFRQTKDPIFYAFFIGVISITVGLLVNALYIDVFESSKVAYTYWSIAGLSLSLAVKLKVSPKAKTKKS